MSLASRNGGRWTEARFEAFVTAVLRSGTRRWQPKYEAVKLAETGTKINKASGRKAKHFKCAKCKKDYPRTLIQVDHKTPIGPCDTWDEFIERLFCEAENLQVLCKTCHSKKTKAERKKNVKKTSTPT